ncbi:MAG TPA: hypothetical protein P5315_10115, partial [Clostridia bacterium]|nr:hypothetical protein [Clostridia bacterium]
MNIKKGLAVVLTLVLLLTVAGPGQFVTSAGPNTSVHLFLDGPATTVTVWMKINDGTVTEYPMSPQ